MGAKWTCPGIGDYPRAGSIGVRVTVTVMARVMAGVRARVMVRVRVRVRVILRVIVRGTLGYGQVLRYLSGC